MCKNLLHIYFLKSLTDPRIDHNQNQDEKERNGPVSGEGIGIGHHESIYKKQFCTNKEEKDLGWRLICWFTEFDQAEDNEEPGKQELDRLIDPEGVIAF